MGASILLGKRFECKRAGMTPMTTVRTSLLSSINK